MGGAWWFGVGAGVDGVDITHVVVVGQRKADAHGFVAERLEGGGLACSAGHEFALIFEFGFFVGPGKIISDLGYGKGEAVVKDGDSIADPDYGAGADGGFGEGT